MVRTYKREISSINSITELILGKFVSRSYNNNTAVRVSRAMKSVESRGNVSLLVRRERCMEIQWKEWQKSYNL